MKLEDFEIQKNLGSGTFSEVYLAKGLVDPFKDQLVALKIVHPKYTTSDREVFERELDLGQRAHQLCPKAVRYDMLFEAKIPMGTIIQSKWVGLTCLVLVMEYLPGICIEEYIMDNEISPRTCLSLLINTAQIISTFHRNKLIHGDVSLANLILPSSDNKVDLTNVRLVDFGGCYDLSKENKHHLSYAFVTGPLYTLPSLYKLDKRSFQRLFIDGVIHNDLPMNDVYALVICGLAMINPLLMIVHQYQLALVQGQPKIKDTFQGYLTKHQGDPLTVPLFNLLWAIYQSCLATADFSNFKMSIDEFLAELSKLQ